MKKSIIIILFLSFILISPLTKANIILPSDFNLTIEDDESEIIKYTIVFHGYKFQGEGISKSSDAIYLDKIWIKTPEFYWYDQIGREQELNKKFVFYNVKISSDGIIGSYKYNLSASTLQDDWILDIKEVTLDNQGLKASGKIYLPMGFKGLPVWFTQNLNQDLKPGPAYMHNYDYNLSQEEGPLHIIESRFEEGMIWFDKGLVSYTTIDNQDLELYIYNFHIDKSGTLRYDPYTFHGDDYQISIGNIDLQIPTIVPYLGGDGLSRWIHFGPTNNNIRIVNSTQNIDFNHPYLDSKEMTGFLNSIKFEASKGFLKKDNLFIDNMSLYLPIKDERAVINLKNVRLNKEGFDFKETEIDGSIISIDGLGDIKIIAIKVLADKLILNGDFIKYSDGLIQFKEKYHIKNLSLQEIIINESGIEFIDLKIPKQKINYSNSFLQFNKLRWIQERKDNSFELLLADARSIFDARELITIYLEETLFVDDQLELFIRYQDNEVKYDNWIKTLSEDSSYRTDFYEKNVGNMNIKVPCIFVIFDDFETRHFYHMDMIYFTTSRNLISYDHLVKLSGSSQEIYFKHPYLDRNNLIGYLNTLKFKTNKANLFSDRLIFDEMFLSFEMNNEEVIISLENIILNNDGFNFTNTSIKESNIHISSLAKIYLTDIKVVRHNVIMDGDIVFKEKATQLLDSYSINNVELQEFIVNGKGIEFLDMNLSEQNINYGNSLIVFDQFRWKKIYKNELLLPAAHLILEDKQGKVIVPLGDSLILDLNGEFWINVVGEKLKLYNWINDR
ncbi:hypothetical protein [Natronospora cellulosivora (SeqCode)]